MKNVLFLLLKITNTKALFLICKLKQCKKKYFRELEFIWIIKFVKNQSYLMTRIAKSWYFYCSILEILLWKF